MKLIKRMERSLGQLAVPNLTLYFIFLQACAYMVIFSNSVPADLFVLDRAKVLKGEWWRVFTFIIATPSSNPIFMIIGLMFLYWIGTNLEHEWGTFRYNVYLFTGYICTAVVAMLIPHSVATNLFFLGSITVAFAWLFPEVTILLMFFFPCKMKWIGAIGWIAYLFAFMGGDWSIKGQVLAAIVPFVLFFHSDLRTWIKLRRHRMATFNQRLDTSGEAFHTCAICGVSDKSDRTMEFRYCPACTGTPCYCINHINNHAHR